MQESIRKSGILIEALPYIQAFHGKVIVAKYGGSALDNPKAMRGILQDLIFLCAVGLRPVLVHGGGSAITARLRRAGRLSRFIDGMRVTDRRTLRVVSRALDEVNARLVGQVRSLGWRAAGVVPRNRLLTARPHRQAVRLGFVGTVAGVRTSGFRRLFARRVIPVVCPIGVNGAQRYNINADHVASGVAAALNAEKLVLLTNVRGILRRPGVASSLIPHLSIGEARRLLARGVIQHGMIPKVRACVDALRGGVKKTHIIDAAIPRALLLEIFTKKGVGTEIVR